MIMSSSEPPVKAGREGREGGPAKPPHAVHHPDYHNHVFRGVPTTARVASLPSSVTTVLATAPSTGPSGPTPAIRPSHHSAAPIPAPRTVSVEA